jgi:hypothetical protein
VDDPHASKVPLERVREERPQRFLRLRHSEPVQIDLSLDSVLTTAQLAQDDLLNAFSGEDQFFATGELGVANVGVQALLQHGVPIGARKPCTRGWAAGRFCSGSVVS